MPPDTVRDATFEVLRRLELTTIFSNPGSTEVPFLAGLPEDLRFVLGLHEGSVVAMAAGHAIGRGAPALALLHSTPGLGNAVAALATARANRAPLVVLVGQQDRRHLALDPFLAGRLQGLAGEYPVWSDQPARPQDVPGAIVRAYHEAVTGRGPAIVVVPMDDWLAPAPEPHELLGPARLLRSAGPDAATVDALADLMAQAATPAIVAGAGADGAAGWAALRALAERLACPVFQEPFGGQAGFPQDHPLFAGHLPARRARLRETLAPHDVVLVVGTGALRQYPFDAGPLVRAGTRVAVVTQDPEEAHRSPVELAVLGDPAAICAALAEAVDRRPNGMSPQLRRPGPPAPPADGEPLRAGHVLAALGERLPRDAILVEETPSSRPELHARVAATEPLGFVSAMGMLGFALPAAIGLRMARPDRPVLAVVGDGSSLYQIQALWSAARYRAGVLFVVLSNGGTCGALRNQPQRYTGRGACVRRLDHVNLLATDVAACRRFAVDVLGYRHHEGIVLDDSRETGAWLSLTIAAHELIYVHDARGARGRLHHLAFWVDTREECLRAADIFLDAGVPIEAAPSKHAVAAGFFLYGFEPGGNRIEVTTGGYLMYDPEHEPVLWTEAERARGQAWGVKTVESFHLYGTPPTPEDRGLVATSTAAG